jgi:cytochrome P450
LFQILHYSIAAASLELPKRLANAEFEKLDRTGAIPMGKSVFLGTSQTISFFLANAWLALLRNPAQLVRLRAEPDLMPRAIEELLRYAGVVHTLFRRATADVDLAGVRISKNERVVLRVGAANRDPAQFPEPDRLNITRRATGQLGLGAGPHSCVGALLVRMAAGIATTAFVSELAVTEMNSSIEWYRNCNVSTPASIRVLLQESRPHVNAQE